MGGFSKDTHLEILDHVQCSFIFLFFFCTNILLYSGYYNTCPGDRRLPAYEEFSSQMLNRMYYQF